MFFFLLIILLFPLTTFAEEPVIHITVEDSPGVGGTSIIDVPLEQDRAKSSQVTEVLARQSGVHVTRYGGLEEATSISIRGSAADEVVFLYDGVPLNTAQGNLVDLASMALDDLEGIRIHKGTAAFATGYGAMGGVIELDSRRDGGRQSNFSFEGGSFGTIKNHLRHRFGKDKWSLTLSHGFMRTDGDFSFEDDNGTPFNQTDDQRVARRNNQVLLSHPSLRLTYDFDDQTRLEMAQHFTFRDQGVPGLSSNLSTNAHLTRREWLGSVKILHDTQTGFFWKSQTYGRWSKSQFADPRAEVGLGGTQDNDDDTTLFGQRFELDFSKVPAHQLRSYIFYQMERFAPQNFAASPSNGGTSVRHQWNVGANYEGSFFENKLTLVPGVWVENIHNKVNNDDPSFVTPGTFANNSSEHFMGAGLQTGYWPKKWFGISANAARNARFPHFSELFGDQGGVLGNPLLSAQKSIEWDAGFQLKQLAPVKYLKNTIFKTAYFDRRVSDLIQFEQQAGFARARNVGDARIQGVEVQIGFTLFDRVDLFGHHTVEFAKDGTTGRNIPGRPKQEFHGGVEAHFKKINPFFHLDWLDANYLDPLNTRRVNNRMIVSGGVTVGPFCKTTLTLEGKNLGESQIVDVVGFPLPGKSFFGKLNFSL